MDGARQEMTREQKVETIARCCHEANRAWCIAHGDTSQYPWDEAAGWQRRSAARGVGVTLSGATPEEQHKAWFDDKLTEGWAYGPTKDEQAKTHPCMVPYEQLPADQRVKDELFGSIVRVLAGPLRLEA